jgi:hypothetical protein
VPSTKSDVLGTITQRVPHIQPPLHGSTGEIPENAQREKVNSYQTQVMEGASPCPSTRMDTKWQ